MRILFFLNSFNYRCWLRLLNFVNFVVVAFSFVRLFVFAIIAYDSNVVIILLMFCSMFLNFLFIFLNFAFIVISTINVESKTTTRRNNDSCKLESIIFAVLSRSKVWIFFFIWVFRLNKDKFVRAFCVLATSSRRLSNDDITSIHTSCYALIRIRKRDYTNVYKASKVWLLKYFYIFCIFNNIIVFAWNRFLNVYRNIL
jgi:hypothetical protein